MNLYAEWGGIMWIKAAWKWLVASLFVLGSLFCFVMAVSLTLADRMPGATLMASMFVVLMLMHYLPQMEYFKAYGIEAKMRAKLNEADEILAKLKAAAIVSGKIAYHVFGWGSRMSHPVRQKQLVADEVDALLKGAGVSEEQLASIKWQYLRFILYDLDYTLRTAILRALKRQDDILVQRINQLGDSDPLVAGLRERRESVGREQNRHRRGLEDQDDYQQKLETEMPPAGLLDGDIQTALDRIKNRVAQVGNECWRTGRLNAEGAEIIDGKGEKLFDEALAVGS